MDCVSKVVNILTVDWAIRVEMLHKQLDNILVKNIFKTNLN